MITKSETSIPISNPPPSPAIPMAEGADQDPSGRRARTIPLPPLAVTRNPAFTTDRMARPLALAITWAGMILSGPFLEVISVNSLSILAAFFASDFKLEGMGLFIAPRTAAAPCAGRGRVRSARLRPAHLRQVRSRWTPTSARRPAPV